MIWDCRTICKLAYRLYVFLSLFRRESLLFFKSASGPSAVLSSFLVTFLMVAVCFAGIGGDDELRIVSVVIICSIFTMQLLSFRLFEREYSSGFLEQLFLHGVSCTRVVLYLLLIHWFFTGFFITILVLCLSLVILGPVMAVKIYSTVTVMTLILAFNNGVGCSLILGKKGGELLAHILCFPLNIPVLIFGIYSIMSCNGFFYDCDKMLLGFLFFDALIGVLLIGYSVSIALEN